MFGMIVYFQNLINAGDISGIAFDILSNPLFWLTVIVTTLFIILPFKLLRTYENLFEDNIVNNLRQKNIDIQLIKKNSKKKLNR